MLTVSHVTKKYGKVVAVNDLSFHLDPGSITVLLGPIIFFHNSLSFFVIS